MVFARVFSAPIPVRKSIWMPFVSAILLALLYLPFSSRLAQAFAPQPKLAPTLQLPEVTSTEQPSTTISVTVSNCTPLSFDTPANVDLDAQSAGFNFQAGPTVTYRIYGDTAQTLLQQIQRCAPRASDQAAAEFTAETGYSLDWHYDIVVDSNSCSLSNVKVGLRTVTALPAWQASPAATPGLADRWTTFMQHLTTHENGHVDIDETYGLELFNDLSSMTNIKCANISDLAHAVIQSDVAVLNQANENYDAQTQHGATQGAVLPTN